MDDDIDLEPSWPVPKEAWGKSGEPSDAVQLESNQTLLIGIFSSTFSY